MDYDNNLRGVLFRNKKKERDNQPEYTGSAELEGKLYWLSAWVKESKNTGEKFFSIAFTPKEEQAEGVTRNTEEDIPF